MDQDSEEWVQTLETLPALIERLLFSLRFQLATAQPRAPHGSRGQGANS